MIRFLLDGQPVSMEVGAQETVLELIRSRLARHGTKEGCAEGDCGACTVLLGEAKDGRVEWRAVNSCILFAPMLDGKALMTVESLADGDDLAPVQREMMERHGSQCGFCTPGFVMSLQGRAMTALGTAGREVADVLSGNLCRCTGYGPILAAGEAAKPSVPEDKGVFDALNALDKGEGGTNWFAPDSADALAALLLVRPDARIVAGATDVGLWVTKQLRDLGTIVFIGDIPDLRGIEETEAGLTLGACVRYSDAWDALTRLHPEMGELVRRIAGTQIRNSGTIGGNIANGSPIGDMPPALIALGARLTLRKGDARREIALEDFFLEYGKQDLAPGEFVERLFIPHPAPATLVQITKLSKRFDSDISAVCGALAVTLEQGVVQQARLAFGGMADVPKRAAQAEAAMTGLLWSEETVEAAICALSLDFTPMDDVRGTSAYRMEVAGNLLRRMWIASDAPEESLSVLEKGLSHG